MTSGSLPGAPGPSTAASASSPAASAENMTSFVELIVPKKLMGNVPGAKQGHVAHTASLAMTEVSFVKLWQYSADG